jgi:hypothetical protein
MRRCGRASCALVVGLLTAAFAAGGAFAGAGGNGTEHGNRGGQGKGHAWAKGHVKHAAAAPQLASPEQPTPKPETKPAPKREAAPRAVTRVHSTPPGAATRHRHVTICHATGSGYVVISPNVNGVANGHMKHHDDFVYVDGCEARAGEPNSDPPNDPAPPANHPPRDPPSPESSPPGATPSGDLPFTGLPAFYLLVTGTALVAAGLALRRASWSS